MTTDFTRRNFLGAAAAASAFPAVLAHSAQGSDQIRYGLIGCGGRGTGAAHNALAADNRVSIVALADLVPDQLNACRQRLSSHSDRANVPARRSFTGFNAYRELLALDDVDVVILATPPHFRPMQFAAAIDAGKHVFMEKPVGVDPTGIRTVLDAGEDADRRKLSVVAGTQRRHELCYRALMDKIESGAIGNIVAARCFWNMGGLWMKEPRDDWSDMEWQIRNWLYFTWLSGDHITEQHVHNLDVVNWAVGTHPVAAMGMGGRQVRTHEHYGNIFDHHAIEYEYPKNVFCMSMCRQIDGCANRVEESLHGTRGVSLSRSGMTLIEGDTEWRYEGENPNPYVLEHRDLIASLSGSGQHYNEAKNVAESTLTAIMGRMSTYSGQRVTWDQALASTLDLAPPAYEFGSIEIPPVAVPGQTAFV